MKCKNCKTVFIPMRPLQNWCSPDCGYQLAMIAKAKKQKKSDAEKKLSLKSRAKWLSEAQAAFNAYIRERDKDLGCICCGATESNQWDCGHYLSVGAHPELRFNENNCHKQRSRPCNKDLSGNIARFRINLIKKIGLEEVEKLEGFNESRKLTIDEIKAIKEMYKQKLKQLTGNL